MQKRRPRASRTLHCETLEPRHMMAVSATLAGGVLDVVGTDGDDTINFYKSGQYIYIQGVDDGWKASQVKSIQVDSLDGDDVVSFDSKANGGRQNLKEKTTVVGGTGTDLVRTAKAHDLYFAGHGNFVQFDGKRQMLLNGNENFNQHVTAKRIGNVLHVDGTQGDDNVYFAQVNGRIHISGVAKSFKASKVGSIIVKLQGGDHAVSLNSFANGGNQALAKYITVYTQAGNNTILLADGSDIDMEGAHTLCVDLAGNGRIDGQAGFTPPAPDPPAPPADWFDTHIDDAGLRALCNTLYADFVFDRSGMLILFQNLIQGSSTIPAVLLDDLKEFVSTKGLFGEHEDVWKLSNYVINGNPANAHYQGQPLGNLAAGSTTEHLQKLVNKWFLGLDRPQLTSSSYTYQQASGSLFVGSPSYAQVRKGNAADDYLLAALATTAAVPARITSMFTANGDGTYSVRVFHGATAEYVTVDSYLPADSSGRFVYANQGALVTSSSNVLWVALAEKAYAQINEMGWLRPATSGVGSNSYGGLSGGLPSEAISQITGRASVIAKFNRFHDAQDMAQYQRTKSMVLQVEKVQSRQVGYYAVFAVERTANYMPVVYYLYDIRDPDRSIAYDWSVRGLGVKSYAYLL